MNSSTSAKLSSPNKALSNSIPPVIPNIPKVNSSSSRVNRGTVVEFIFLVSDVPLRLLILLLLQIKSSFKVAKELKEEEEEVVAAAVVVEIFPDLMTLPEVEEVDDEEVVVVVESKSFLGNNLPVVEVEEDIEELPNLEEPNGVEEVDLIPPPPPLLTVGLAPAPAPHCGLRELIDPKGVRGLIKEGLEVEVAAFEEESVVRSGKEGLL